MGLARESVSLIYKKRFQVLKNGKSNCRFLIRVIKKKQNLISTKQKKIKSMYEEITKQGFVLDPTLKKSKEERFRKEQVDFERYVQDKKEEFGRKEKEITEKIFTKMIKVVRKIGSEKKFSVIMDEKTLLYSDSALDISNIAVKTYDRIYK